MPKAVLPDLAVVLVFLRQGQGWTQAQLCRAAGVSPSRLDAGVGRPVEALAAFGQVRRIFLEQPLPYDYALVSLDLSLVLLEQGRTAEVAQVAEEMLWIFQSQEVQEGALAALRVFCDAASQETATVELTRRVERFLRRAQLDPDLRFEERGTGA